MGDVCPLHPPSGTSCRPPYSGENTLLSSLRAFVPVFLKANLFAMGGRRGVGNFDLSMPFRVWAS